MIGRWFSDSGRGALAAVAVSLVGAGFSAHAGLNSPSEVAAPAPPPPAGFEAQDHFPGAALLYVDAQEDMPATGATGTVALPAAPVTSDTAPIGDGSIQPAAAFALRGSILDKSRALLCLTTTIYYEAANEPDDGQAAVAQVVLNRVRHATFPGTVCGVVYQGSETRGCQFSFACDGALARVPVRDAWNRSRRAAARALAGYVFAPVGLATHYHTYAVTPAWNSGLVMTGAFGAHLFHRWRGWWGTPAAFGRRYAGGEPLPGPHVQAAPPPVMVAASVPRTAAPSAPVAGGAVQERYAERTDDPQILDKWKDSGQPLR